MQPWLDGKVGNPASIHAFGQAAREATEEARQEVARLIGARSAEIVFTSSGTEANNAVLNSSIQSARHKGHLVVSAIEHPSIEQTAVCLAETGIEVTWIAPDTEGRVDADEMAAAIRPDTSLICLMAANNIVGTLQSVRQIALAAEPTGVPILCDAVQAVGKIPVNVETLGVDFLTLGAHKFYGPLGAAALWIRRQTPYTAFLTGGSQERHRRAGTINVPAVVGMGEAAKLAAAELESRAARMQSLRDRFEQGLAAIPDVKVHAVGAKRLPNTSHVAFAGVDSQSLLIRLDLAGFAVSAGSACSSGTVEPSRTILAMGVSRDEAMSSLRMSFGVGNTEAEINGFLEVLSSQVAELRRLAGSTV